MSLTAGDNRMVALELRMASEGLWHFSERRLRKNQHIELEPGADGRHAVTATLSMSEMLVPFLLSLGESVEVAGPPELRAEVARRVQATARQYAGAPAASGQ
jgi:predicted DNA-binding transcriptional regulator YafY